MSEDKKAELRLQCLEIALNYHHNVTVKPADIVDISKQYYDFVSKDNGTGYPQERPTAPLTLPNH